MTVELWASNFGPATKGKIEVHALDICTGWKGKVQSYDVTLEENRSTEVWKGECPAPPKEEAYDKYAPSGSVVLHAILRTENETVSRISNWPEPYKLLELPDPGLKVKVEGEDVTVSCEKPCKGVWLDVEGDNDGLEWSDNGVSHSQHLAGVTRHECADFFDSLTSSLAMSNGSESRA